MASIHPPISSFAVLSPGDYRERDVLSLLEVGLPAGFDVFHQVSWSSVHEGQQRYGELDVVVLSPIGHVTLLEVKAGSVDLSDAGMFKTYRGAAKNIGSQIKTQFSAWLARLNEAGLTDQGVKLSHFLVLPDQKVEVGTIAFPRDRIIDASEMDGLCTLLKKALVQLPDTSVDRARVQAFIENRLKLIPDAAVHVGQAKAASTRLAEGLATWVPRVVHQCGVYRISATAGSGKTQLALALMKKAMSLGQRCAYVCFNRPLADHIARVAPSQCEVSSFHQLSAEHFERVVGVPDFTEEDIFTVMAARYIEDSARFDGVLDLLILDEAQDFESEWLEALHARLKSSGSLYVLLDEEQALYVRAPFEVQGAVEISCQDNFRSPKSIVEVINQLRLTFLPVEAKAPHAGKIPEFVVYGDAASGGVREVGNAVAQLIEDGFSLDQITVLSFAGRTRSRILDLDEVGGHRLRKFTGVFDRAGNAVWSEGELLAETIYRFKGQSSPAVVLCEIDFEMLTDKDLRKLFVGFTRAQMQLTCVISERASVLLAARLNDE
jgi:superfamily I DNA and RNA helicase